MYLEKKKMQHEKLEVYQEARSLARKMMELGDKKYPSFEFNNQILAAALSIPLNIAEGSGRTSPKERAHFYSIARGSTAECASFCDMALDLKIINEGLSMALKAHCQIVSKMLFGAIRSNRAAALNRP